MHVQVTPKPINICAPLYINIAQIAPRAKNMINYRNKKIFKYFF